jgi:hypothetical protein
MEDRFILAHGFGQNLLGVVACGGGNSLPDGRQEEKKREAERGQGHKTSTGPSAVTYFL